MSLQMLGELLMPLLGTSLGAACVFFVKGQLPRSIQRAFTGFAAGVMVAASVWSLIIPSMEQSEPLGKMAFMPVIIGLFAGFGFLMLLDLIIPHLHMNSAESEGPRSSFKRSTMMVLAVALHNLPEGMAVGVILAGALSGDAAIPTAAAFTLSLGIAIQNFPEGAIISVPLHSNGISRKKSFFMGFLSGVVEPIAALLTVLAASFIAPALPYVLSFAAGAMLYVVVEELIPEMSVGEHSHIGTTLFAVGFAIMIILEVALG